MRTKTVLRNSIYSFSSYIILFALGLINRRIFLQYLNIEFLGYEGLFTNIFSMLSLAEMGVGSVITYNLYHEIAVENKNEIAKLMMIYKNIYRIVGCIVVISGLIILPFLNIIINDNVTNWTYIRYIYIVQLLGTICTYFLAYRRTLFIANQMEFICVKIDTVGSIIGQVIKIIILIITQNYILYLSVAIFQNVITNLVIAKKYNVTFSYARKAKVTRLDLQKRQFFKDVSNFMVHKISYLIYGGVSNIIITAIMGISTVGLYSNYTLIKNQVWSVIGTFFKPVQATIGNLIYSKDEDRAKQIFYMFDLISFFIASFVSISLFVIFQPFVELWVGKDFILPLSFVLFLAVNIYMCTIHEILYYFRSSFGNYENDRNYMILAAITNLFLSIILVYKIGLTGIMIASDIGLGFIWFGRIKVFYRNYLQISYKSYIIKHIGWIILALIEGTIIFLISQKMPISIIGLFERALLCLIMTNGINLLLFYKNKNFILIKQYLNQIFKIIKDKIR